MVQTPKKPVFPILDTPQEQKISTTSSERNQDQFPFLYMAMREPSKEYREIPDTKKTLYRIIKIK